MTKPSFQLRAAFALALFSVAACKNNPTSPANDMASVQFTVTSPFCGPISYTIDFAADSVPLGTEALKNLGASKTYAVKAGRRVLGAYVENWHLSFDTTVTLAAGQTFVRDVNLYCS